MITKSILSFILGIFGNIFTAITLPGLPTDALNSAKDFLTTILSNLSLLGLFIRPSTLKITATTLLALMTFKFLYPKAMFLISKLPFVKK